MSEPENTLRKKNKELTRQIYELEIALTATTVHFTVFDRDGHYLYVNPVGLQAQNVSLEDVRGKTWREMGFPEEVGKPFDERLEKVFIEAEPVRSEALFPTKDGMRIFETVLQPAFNEAGEVVAAVATHQDITQRRQAEEALRETNIELEKRTGELAAALETARQLQEKAEIANQAKDTFLANMSHELRTPLNTILGFTQIMRHNQTLSRDVHDNLGVIMRSGEYLLALINQLLDLSKVEAGHMVLNETDFDLYRLLDDLEDMFFLGAREKQLHLEFDIANEVPQHLRADVTKLRQTLINLISNALKFTTDGSVGVRVTKTEGEGTPESPSLRLQFEVKDTGAGILPEEIPKLFESFVQASAGRQAREGAGLGLAISQGFVNLMGGVISVTSKVGQGSSFVFDISCQVASDTETQAMRHHRQVAGLAPGQPQYRIMVVDDKPTQRKFLLEILELLGFQIKEAENGEQAIEIAESFKPHLIWMDVQMPVMNGIDATRRLKALPVGQTMKIIALTASGVEEDSAEMIAAGCDGFVRKPIHTDTVFDLLSEHIGVEYVYVDAAQPQEVSQYESLSPDRLAAALNTIPADLLGRLIENLKVGDVMVINNTIVEIREYDTILAGILDRLAQRFQFDEMLGLLSGDKK